jgi:hypothetical protein
VKKATLAVAFLFLAACSKQETKIPTPADLGNQRTESGPRATFIRNLDLGTHCRALFLSEFALN